MASSLLSSHLEQISLCASSIADLPFPGPKIFANALLAPHEITALIRDTEAHERALFSVAPPPIPTKAQVQELSASLSGSVASSVPGNRRTTFAPSAARPPRRHTAVAAVLGGDLYRRVRKAGDEADAGRFGRTRERGDIDVEVLLEGAEKLCGVYPVPGAADKIARLRSRYQQLSDNIAHYEAKVSKQAAQLDRMNSNRDYDDMESYINEDEEAAPPAPEVFAMTKEDLLREEQEIRDLERKKRGLEERVTGMEKDLGGLMR